AAKTELPQAAAPLEIGQVLIDFPDLQSQRMITRTLVTIPAASLKAAPGEKGDEVRVVVEGLVEQASGVFEDFRVRFKVPAPKAAEPVALSFERQLRPDRQFLMRLRVRDEVSGAEAMLTRGFKVPRLPEPSPEWDAINVAQGEEMKVALQTADSLVLLPPAEEVVFGLWRADALVTGERIQKVTFLLDGKAQVSRGRPPFTAEIRLPAVPTEGIVRAEGYDAQNRLVAADEVVLNRPREAFRVAVTEPAEGAAVSGRTRVTAEVTVPEARKVEKVEFSLNDQPVATLTQPPWQVQVDIPGDEIVYVTVAATLDNDDRLEEVRFLRAPENLEHIDVQLVELFATVTDRSGQVVRGLVADDFEVLEQGKPQPLSKFELVENLPLTVGLVLDTSGSMEASLSEAQRAAADFLKSVVKPKDRAFAMQFAGKPNLLIAPTDDIEAVSQSLQNFQAVGMTALHDAVVASLHYFRSTRGQRALVLLSDGDDTASAVSFEDALEYARRSGVAVYTIGLKVGLGGVSVRNKLNRLAESTGGRSFYIDKAEELSSVYGQIEQELRSRYLLAFQTQHPEGEKTYRAVEVRVKKSGLKARTARGYYP
ncbi:MAG TPA: VWA domain-containing protein, partial [Thermoanaerobaculia bacterium]|nr:VWA domain-containing protein [Thermoanaerobaculia bacterium]